MRTSFIAIAAVSLSIATLALPAFGQTPLSTAFTYQGRLDQAGAPLDGTADFQFSLFNAAIGGLQIGSTQAVSNVTVADGLFTASLDFGIVAFNGDARWLQIAVRSPAGGGAFTTLSPRQPLTATPYALQTRGIFVDAVKRVGIGTTAPLKPLQVVPIDGIHVGGDPGNGGFTGLTLSLSSPMDGYARIQATEASGIAFGNLALNSLGGNVGIGTASPVARLDVRGDVKLGPSGQYFAPSGGENLRIIRGNVDGNGTILDGSGFSVIRFFEGEYRIAFSPAFSGTPSVTVTAHGPSGGDSRFAQFEEGSLNANQVSVEIWTSGQVDSDFSFIAIGPR